MEIQRLFIPPSLMREVAAPDSPSIKLLHPLLEEKQALHRSLAMNMTIVELMTL